MDFKASFLYITNWSKDSLISKSCKSVFTSSIQSPSSKKEKTCKPDFFRGYHDSELQSIEFRNQAEHWLNKLPNVYKLINFNKSSENIKKNTNKINPIFIIGVPRCGSTLVEKIIVSGNKYIPAGEETQILNLFVRQNIKQNLLFVF